MKMIIPMAGLGKRMRPHTLTTPKPLIQLAGKPIVQRLVEDIAEMCDEPFDEIAFVIGDFGKEAEVPMAELIPELLELVDDVVDDLGSRGAVEYIHTILNEGTSAERQLRVYQQTGDLKDVVRHLVMETRASAMDVRSSSAGTVH